MLFAQSSIKPRAVMILSLFACSAFWTAISACSRLGIAIGSAVCVCNSTFCDDLKLVPPPSSGQYHLYTSSEGGLRFDWSQKNYDAVLQAEGILFAVHPHQKYQCIEGFGGTLTDSAAMNMASLSKVVQEALLESYFGSNGIGYSVLRVPIAGTEFSLRPYTYADTRGSAYSLSRFNLSTEDIKYRIPLLQRIRKVTSSKLRLIAAAWTAPKWMRNEDHSLQTEFFPDWAQYHIKFLEKYEKHGCRFWLLSTGNKPMTTDMSASQTLEWLPKDHRVWVAKHLIPALKGSKFKSVELLTLDDDRSGLPWWIDILMEDKTVNEHVRGIGVHWYFDRKMPPAALDLTQMAYPDKFLLTTQASHILKLKDDFTRRIVFGSWTRAESYAENIIENMNHWVRGWIDLNLVLDTEGGPNWMDRSADSPIIVNATADEFYKQPMFYAIGHFSKFVPTGSVRVGLIGGTPDVQGIAFITNAKQLVVVVLNKTIRVQQISIAGTEDRGFANFVIPAKSITTFTSKMTAPAPSSHCESQ